MLNYGSMQKSSHVCNLLYGITSYAKLSYLRGQILAKLGSLNTVKHSIRLTQRDTVLRVTWAIKLDDITAEAYSHFNATFVPGKDWPSDTRKSTIHNSSTILQTMVQQMGPEMGMRAFIETLLPNYFENSVQ